jgi:death on curing protein
VRYLTLGEILALYERLLAQSGGSGSIRDLGALESAVAQPRMTFAGQDLYPDVVTKAAALAYSLIQNHPFVDGNKRAGHAALETFLMLNNHHLESTVDEAERIILGVAAGEIDRDGLATWIRRSLRFRSN